MIYLYTENFFWKGRARNWIKKLVGKNFGGPQGVFKSLLEGLWAINREVEVNKLTPLETAGIINGANVLEWAIRQKQLGNIKKIIAGPNILTSPLDRGGLLANSLIDKVVVPSAWVKEYYEKVCTDLVGRVEIWPAGVSLPAENTSPKTLDFLVYNKIGDNVLVREILENLKKHNLTFCLFEYGKFSQRNYFQMLKKSKYEIYLSKSESQGLAMVEAWAHNVPTLVWESGSFDYQLGKIIGQVSAPYLRPEAGMAFSGAWDFETVLQKFMMRRFSPREYAAREFSNLVSAQRYLSIYELK